MQIGIWRPGGVGDALLLAPALRTLRSECPEASIHLWGHTEACYLLLYMGLCDSFNDHRQGLRFTEHAPDVLVGFEWDPAAFYRHVQTLGIEHPTVRPWIAPAGLHQSEHHHRGIMRAVESDAPFNGREPFEIAVPQRIHALNERWRGATLLHVGAGMYPKRYPFQRFMTLARTLDLIGHEIVLLESPDDDYGNVGPFPVLNRPWLDMAFILSEARAYVGCDTGLTHLAAMLGTPTVGLYGPTQPLCWGPMGARAVWLNTCPRMQATTEVIYDANHACFADLQPEHIRTALQHVLRMDTKAA